MAGKISESFKDLKKHLDDALAKFKQEIKNDLQTTAADLQKTATEVKDAVKSLESVWAEIKDLKEKQDVLNEENETLKTSCDELRCEKLKLKKQIYDNQDTGQGAKTRGLLKTGKPHYQKNSGRRK